MNEETLEKVDFSLLISSLQKQRSEKYEKIQLLFEPSNYLLSPFNSTKQFIESKYFLTDHQRNIKKSIINEKSQSGPTFFSIQGSAGTGKTLLTYNIVKYYKDNFNKVLVLHCSGLNNGHKVLSSEYEWTISTMKDYNTFQLDDYDLIVIDEAQRMTILQLEGFLESVGESDIKCIFSYAANQCLSSWGIRNNIQEYIENQLGSIKFSLTNKIRTNKEIDYFIRSMINLTNRSPNQKYSNIEVHYFSTNQDAKEYMEVLQNKGWKVISYTPSRYNVFSVWQVSFARE